MRAYYSRTTSKVLPTPLWWSFFDSTFSPSKWQKNVLLTVINEYEHLIFQNAHWFRCVINVSSIRCACKLSIM